MGYNTHPKRKLLRDYLQTIVLTPGMLAHVDIAGEDDKTEILPAAQLWKRQDLLDRKVMWEMRDRDEYKRPRLILLLGQAKKERN